MARPAVQAQGEPTVNKDPGAGQELSRLICTRSSSSVANPEGSVMEIDYEAPGYCGDAQRIWRCRAAPRGGGDRLDWGVRSAKDLQKRQEGREKAGAKEEDDALYVVCGSGVLRPGLGAGTARAHCQGVRTGPNPL